MRHTIKEVLDRLSTCLVSVWILYNTLKYVVTRCIKLYTLIISRHRIKENSDRMKVLLVIVLLDRVQK